jgi:hypothetical protein
MARYKFPLDLNSGDTTYKGAILFQPYKVIPPAYSFAGSNQASRSTDASRRRLDSLTPPPVSGRAAIEYAASESCMLYMPPSIQIGDAVELENVDLGLAGQGLQNALNSGLGGAAALKEYVDNGVSSVTEIFSGNLSGDVARLAASRASGLFSDKVAGAVRSSLLTAPNPNTRVIFKSISLREFSFDFKMVPQSKKEADMIKNIIHFFRRNLYPKTINVGGSEDGFPVGYRFPNKFGVTLSYGGKSMEDIGYGKSLNFQKMYLKGMNTNYNPTSMSFHKDGSFAEIDFSLRFTESRALTFEDISEETDQELALERARRSGPFNPGGR